MKISDQIQITDLIKIQVLPGVTPVTLGAGTVPTSGVSISATSMSDLQKSTKAASKLGIYDTAAYKERDSR